MVWFPLCLLKLSAYTYTKSQTCGINFYDRFKVRLLWVRKWRRLLLHWPRARYLWAFSQVVAHPWDRRCVCKTQAWGHPWAALCFVSRRWHSSGGGLWGPSHHFVSSFSILNRWFPQTPDHGSARNAVSDKRLQREFYLLGCQQQRLPDDFRLEKRQRAAAGRRNGELCSPPGPGRRGDGVHHHPEAAQCGLCQWGEVPVHHLQPLRVIILRQSQAHRKQCVIHFPLVLRDTIQ